MKFFHFDKPPLMFFCMFFIDKFNRIIRIVESCGLTLKWSRNQRLQSIAAGKKRAVKNMEIFKIFDGKSQHNDDGEGSIVPLLISVVRTGAFLGLCSFVCELLAKWFVPAFRKLSFYLERCTKSLEDDVIM